MYVDVNVTAGAWPHRTAPDLSMVDLESCLSEEGIGKAYVSSISAIFREDPAKDNQDLIANTKTSQKLKAVPVLNPRMKNCLDLVRRYDEQGTLPAVKVHPNFHGYDMRSDAFGALAQRLSVLRRPLLVPLRMEDERFQNPQMQISSIPIDSVTTLALAFPKLKIICLNAYRKEVLEGVDPPNLSFDISFVDWFKPIDYLLHHLSSERILFGSHTPLFVTRAAVMKLAYADASAATKALIAGGNAERLLV